MIQITAKNFKLTNGIKTSIEDKLKKFNKFVDVNEKVEVILDSKKYGSKIEVFFNIDGTLLKAESTHDDLYVAIDLVVDKLTKQVRRYTDKANSVNKDSIRHGNITFNETKEEENIPQIVRRKFISAKPMFEEEAVLQMELLDHKSFVFYNADTQSVCMLYKRIDGDYGIIEPR